MSKNDVELFPATPGETPIEVSLVLVGGTGFNPSPSKSLAYLPTGEGVLIIQLLTFKELPFKVGHLYLWYVALLSAWYG